MTTVAVAISGNCIYLCACAGTCVWHIRRMKLHVSYLSNKSDLTVHWNELKAWNNHLLRFYCSHTNVCIYKLCMGNTIEDGNSSKSDEREGGVHGIEHENYAISLILFRSQPIIPQHYTAHNKNWCVFFEMRCAKSIAIACFV